MKTFQKNGQLYVEGVVLKVGERMGSGDTITKEALLSAFAQRKEFLEHNHGGIDGRTGILDISHYVTDLRLEGDALVAEARILDATPAGGVLAKTIRALTNGNLSDGVDFTYGIEGYVLERKGNELHKIMLKSISINSPRYPPARPLPTSVPSSGTPRQDKSKK